MVNAARQQRSALRPAIADDRFPDAQTGTTSIAVTAAGSGLLTAAANSRILCSSVRAVRPIKSLPTSSTSPLSICPAFAHLVPSATKPRCAPAIVRFQAPTKPGASDEQSPPVRHDHRSIFNKAASGISVAGKPRDLQAELQKVSA